MSLRSCGQPRLRGPKEVRRHGWPTEPCRPPPPPAGPSPPEWERLPEPNRSHLVRLLSQIVERRLVAMSRPSEEGRDDRDAERGAGGRADDGGAAVGAALGEDPVLAPRSAGAGVRPAVDA